MGWSGWRKSEIEMSELREYMDATGFTEEEAFDDVCDDRRVLAEKLTDLEAENELLANPDKGYNAELRRGIEDLQREIDEMREAHAKEIAARDAHVACIRIFGSDTLSGRADGGPEDTDWYRSALVEVVKRCDAVAPEVVADFKIPESYTLFSAANGDEEIVFLHEVEGGEKVIILRSNPESEG